MDRYVRVTATSEWKDMSASWQVAFDSPVEDEQLKVYTNAVFDLVAVTLGKLGQVFTVAEETDPPTDPEALMARVNTIQAAIQAA